MQQTVVDALANWKSIGLPTRHVMYDSWCEFWGMLVLFFLSTCSHSFIVFPSRRVLEGVRCWSKP